MAPQLALNFGELLEKLREAHEVELRQLRQENAGLRAEVKKPSSRWRDLTRPYGQPDAAAVKDAFHIASTAAQEAAGVRPLGQPPPPLKQPAVAESNSSPRQQLPCTWAPGGVPALEPVSAVDGKVSVSQDGSKPSNFRGFGSRRSSQSAIGTSTRATYVFEDIVPKEVNFAVLTMERFPDRQWHELTSGEKVGLLRDALRPRHVLINPHSFFMKRWDVLTVFCLVFVGIVTPYEVVFLHSLHLGLFGVNRFVDFIFMVDMFLNFFLAVEIQRPHRGGSVMLRDPRKIRCRYLKSWFFIDLVSIFPFDILKLVVDTPVLQQAKILRCIKLLRLAKLLRILNTSKILERWRHAVSMQFATKKLIKFVLVLVVVSHWMACLWGLAGLHLGAELCDSNGQLIEYGSAGVSINEVSWVTTLYMGGKTSPDSPCNHLELYASSLHWAVMTLTSIGYGDIVPVRVEEYFVGIVCMVIGGVLWAYIIGCLCSIMSHTSPVDARYETNTDLLNLAMSDAHVPQKERQKYREFLREAKAYDRGICFRQVAQTFSPMLQKHLMYHITKESLAAVYYFNDPEAPATFLMDVSSCLVPHFFSPREPLDSLRHCLCMLDRGTVAHGGLILVPPSVFHEDFIITQKKYQQVIRTISLTYTQVLVLTRAHMEEILVVHPRFERKIRKVAARAAFCKAVKLTMAAYENCKSKNVSLSEAFDSVCGDATFALPKPMRARRKCSTIGSSPV